MKKFALFALIALVAIFGFISCDSTGGDDKVDPCANGHSFTVFQSTVDPTCTDGGYDIFKCSRCTVTENKNLVSALGHTGILTGEIAATCTEPGNTGTGTCDRCDAVLTGEIIPALGHTYAAEWEFNSTHHWHECIRCDDKNDNAAHTISDWIIDLEATETVPGSQYKECTICKYEIERETIPATGGGTLNPNNVTLTINNMNPGNYQILINLDGQQGSQLFADNVIVDDSGTLTVSQPYSKLVSWYWNDQLCNFSYRITGGNPLNMKVTNIPYLCEKGANFILDADTDF